MAELIEEHAESLQGKGGALAVAVLDHSVMYDASALPFIKGVCQRENFHSIECDSMIHNCSWIN